MTKIEQKIMIEDYLPDDVDKNGINDIVTSMYCYYLEKSNVPIAAINDMKFLLFIHPHMFHYVARVEHSRLIRKSNLDIWKESWNMEVVVVKDMVKNKIVMMEGF